MSFAIREFPFGPGGVGWSDAGLTRIAFDRNAEALRRQFAALGDRETERLPLFARTAMARLRDHLAGRPQEFTDLPMDLRRTPPSFRELAGVLRATRAGETVDAEALAARAGVLGGSTAVRRLLGRNPLLVLVPGHRVLGEGGRLGRWGGGEVLHERLLGLESMAHPPLYAPDGGPLPERVEVALASLRGRDPDLARLIDRVGAFRLSLGQGLSPYQALARSIVGQQITGHAARAILARLAVVFGTVGVPAPGQIRSAPDALLRAAGLSAGKARALRDLAGRALAGGVPGWAVLRGWPNERIVTTLTEIHGIGRWTVEMLLVFRLGRPDVLPLGDYGVRKGYARTFTRGRLPSARELERRGWRWRPFRSVASWYLYRALELP